MARRQVNVVNRDRVAFLARYKGPKARSFDRDAGERDICRVHDPNMARSTTRPGPRPIRGLPTSGHPVLGRAITSRSDERGSRHRWVSVLTCEMMVSRPIGGVLFGRPLPGSPLMTIHLCGLPGNCSLSRAGRSTHVPRLALLRVGVASCRDRSRHWCALTAPFHPCLCPSRKERAIGGLFSVARSDRSPRPDSRQHPDRWSPDLPRHSAVAGTAPRPSGRLTIARESRPQRPCAQRESGFGRGSA